MSLTVNSISYENDTQRTPDSQRYTGPNDTLTVKDYIDVKRTAPKPSSDSAGKGRSQIKLTRTMTDGTDSVGDGIVSFDTSIPVGAQSSEIQAMLTDLGTFLLTATADEIAEELHIIY